MEKGEAQWRYTEATLAKIARRNGTPLLVFAFRKPDEVASGRFDVPLGRLARAVEEQGQQFLDLFDVFVEGARHGEPLFFDPVHPTPQGHALAARAVMEQLARLDVVGSTPSR